MDTHRWLTGLRQLTPPALWNALRRVRHAAARRGLYRSEWQYLPGGWAAVDADRGIAGWDHPSVAATQRRNWPIWKQTIAPPGIVGCAYHSPVGEWQRLDTHNANMVLAYSVLLAARGRDALSLLDWGSGPGQSYELLRSLVPHLALDYHGRDLPSIVALGRELVPQATFHDDDACLEQRYDIVIASSSLSYARDWRRQLQALARATSGHLLISRQPLTRESASYVFVQRPHRFGYQTAYAGWCIGRAELVAAASEAGLELVREMVIGEGHPIAGAPGACGLGAFLFRQPATAW